MKKIISLLVPLIMLPILACGAEKQFPIFGFNGGLVDVVSKTDIADNATPDCGNVSLDEDVGVVKRKAYKKYNSTPLPGAKNVPSGYVYNKNDGTKYIIVQSSSFIKASQGDGSFTTIRSTGCTASRRYTFATALDNLYGGNGTDEEFMWDGSARTDYNVENSTNMVRAKLHLWHNNRMFRAGVTGFASTLFYSELIDPANMGTGTNFEPISKDSGERITGLAKSPDGSYMVIFMERSIWGLYGTDPASWQIKCIVPNVGCLYDTTIDYLNGSLVFFSERGLDSFNGSSCKLLSVPIDRQIKSLSQRKSGVSEWSQSAASDWGNGTTVNADTTTYGGSVTIGPVTSYKIVTSSGDFGEGSGVNVDTTSSVGNVILVKTNVSSTNIAPTGTAAVQDAIGNFTIGDVTKLNDGNAGTATTVHQAWGMPEVSEIYLSLTFAQAKTIKKIVVNVTISGDIDRTILFYPGGFSNLVNGINTINLGTPISGTWLRLFSSAPAHEGGSADVSWNEVYVYEPAFESTGTYISKTFDFSAAPAAWGNLGANFSLPTGTTVQFHSRSSTNGSSWDTWVDETTGAAISSALKRYLQVGCTLYSNTALSTSPVLNDVWVMNTDYGSFKSVAYQASNWINWGVFRVGQSVPDNSSINYYVITATSSYNLTTKASSPISDNSVIPQNNGDWIVFVASMTRTAPGVLPTIYDFTLDWASTLNKCAPAGKTYNDVYYLAVSTDSSTALNNVIYRYNRNGIFDLWNQINAMCFFEYNGDLYFGDSNDTGFIYWANIDGTYVDEAGYYNSWYQTKTFDFGFPFQDKYYKSIWITTRDTTDPINIRYRLDGVGGWTSTTYVPAKTYDTKKMNLPQATKGKFIELRADSTSYFNLRGGLVVYEEDPLQ